MANLPLLILQYVHITFGAVLVGSAMFMHFVLWPVILRRPSREGKAFCEASLQPTSVLMGVSSGVTFLTGIIRGTLYGSLRTWDSLGTPYGITFLVAFVIMFGMMFHGPRIGPSLLKRVWKGTSFVPNAKQIVKSSLLIPFISVTVILACMALMHFGL